MALGWVLALKKNMISNVVLKLRMVGGKLEWKKCFYIGEKKQGGWSCVFFFEKATLFNLNSPPKKRRLCFFEKTTLFNK